MRIFLLFIITLIITSCSTKKVVKNHGITALQKKSEKIYVTRTNTNDIIDILGPPSTKSSFNDNIWLYIERQKINQSIFKLGKKKIAKNNVLILEFDEMGILIDKDFFDISKMNDLKFSKKLTQKGYSKNSFVYSFLTSLREKINSPVKKRLKKKTNQQ